MLEGHCAVQPASPDGQPPQLSAPESQQELVALQHELAASVETMEPPLNGQHDPDEDSRYINAETTHPAPKSPTPTSFKIDMVFPLF
jgi:hypothetical protein